MSPVQHGPFLSPSGIHQGLGWIPNAPGVMEAEAADSKSTSLRKGHLSSLSSSHDSLGQSAEAHTGYTPRMTSMPVTGEMHT